MLERQPGHAAAQRELAGLLAAEARDCREREEDGEQERCRSKLQEALKLDPRSLPASLLQVEWDLAEETLGPQEAALRLQQVVLEHPQSSDARLALGSCLLDLGDVPGALEQFHQGSRLAPADVRHQVRLAEALARVNEQDALARLRRLLALHPDSVPVLLGLSRLLASKGRLGEAFELLDRAGKVAPESNEVRWARRRLERQRSD